MRILITGVNGYIGKSLFNALKDKHKVSGINRQIVDLTDSVAVRQYFNTVDYFNVVIHCATEGASNPRSNDWNMMDNNLKMYYNLLQNKECYNKFINFGSGAEIYLLQTPYGLSKKVIANSISCKDNHFNLRIFGLFDENELETRFIKGNIKRYINKEPIQIHQNKGMDFFYMQDLIKVIEYYINENEPPKEFDCVYNKTSYTLFRLACLINKLDNYEINIINKGENGDDYVSKYRDTILPIEFIGLEQGIKNVYNRLKNEC